MAEETRDLKLGTLCRNLSDGSFVKIVGIAASGEYVVQEPGNPSYEARHDRLDPIPDWVFKARAEAEFRSALDDMTAGIVPSLTIGEVQKIEYRNPLVDFVNSLNQGVRITIESLYEPEAKP